MKHRFTFLAVPVSAALALAACSQSAPADTAASDDTAMADAAGTAATTADASDHASQFLTDAMKGDNSEVRVGKLAAEKGSTQGVKDFGRMLAEEHGSHLQKVAAVAQSLGVPTTDETKPEADQVYAKLQGLSGKDFDQAFIIAMIEDHKKTIATYQQEASSGDAAAVTDLAKQTVPTLQKHLETAQSLQNGT